MAQMVELLTDPVSATTQFLELVKSARVLFIVLGTSADLDDLADTADSLSGSDSDPRVVVRAKDPAVVSVLREQLVKLNDPDSLLRNVATNNIAAVVTSVDDAIRELFRLDQLPVSNRLVWDGWAKGER